MVWFRWLGEWNLVSGRLEEVDQRIRFGSFVSKHALALQAICDDRDANDHQFQLGENAPKDEQLSGSTSVLNEILDWALEEEVVLPSRRSSPSRIIDSVQEWHGTLWNDLEFEPDVQLAAAPSSMAVIDGVSAVALTTVGELMNEGREMQHCVGAYASQGVDGKSFFYRATVSEQRVTIAVAKTGNRWRLVEASGFANSRVVDMPKLHRWVDSLAVSDGNDAR